MSRLFALISAISLSLAGFTFDMDVVQSLPILYPLVSLSLGSICIVSFLFFFLCSKNAKIKLRRPVARIGFVFFVIYVIGIISSLTSGAGDLLAFGNKSATLLMNFLYLSFGAFLSKTKFSVKFSKYFFLISLVLALILPYMSFAGVNPNWVGITLVFSILFYWLCKEGQISDKNMLFWLLLIALYSIIVLKARGVFIALAVGGGYIGLFYFFPKRVKKWVDRFIFMFLPMVGIFVSFLGIWLYRSRYYEPLMSWSIQTTGKNLDSSRLERWALGFKLFKDNPFIGWGVDAHISRAVFVTDMGDLHNLWWEYLFRFGLIGGFLLFCVFMYTSTLLYLGHTYTVDVVAYLVIFVFLSVYALGGVTHWPGAYMFWYVIGLMLSRSTYKKGSFHGYFTLNLRPLSL